VNELPLIDRARRDGVSFQISESPNPLRILDNHQALLPSRQPAAGEQYRFHFDMTKCIGCKCCVVACNEQNGNPSEIQWRKVGEVEGGIFPSAERFHLSMACNHCVEPSCLLGCPVEAYTKDSKTGIVLHSADTCIGCQYCVWNCSYQVPQFNEERGVVGKCDMCYHRLEDRTAPACVNACPEGAIAIEIVPIAHWRTALVLANAPGVPDASDSISTTRITLPQSETELLRVDRERLDLEHAHPSLIAVLLLSQLSVGLVAATLIHSEARLPLLILSSLAMSGCLAIAPAHLGRPIHAHRAWRGWRTSWVSREAIGFSLFAGLLVCLTGATWGGFIGAGTQQVGAMLSVAVGTLALYASAKIYRLKARPAWNLASTEPTFLAAAAMMGGLIGGALTNTNSGFGLAATISFAALELWRQHLLRRDPQQESQLSLDLYRRIQTSSLILGGSVLATLWTSWFAPMAAPVFGIVAVALSRWQFFVTVVPKRVSTTYVREAA
jgi:formate dehydrogenase iron-sulfur subunit